MAKRKSVTKSRPHTAPRKGGLSKTRGYGCGGKIKTK